MAQKSVASASARRQGLGGSRKALIGQTVTQTAPFNASRASLSWRVADCPPGSTEAAQKLGGGSSKNLRDSHSKRLGVKIYGERDAKVGNVIVRQRGSQYKPGKGTQIGHDHTIFAIRDGIVRYQINPKEKKVHVIDHEYANPGGQPSPTSRRARKRQQYPPRAQRRAHSAAAAEKAATE